MPRIMNYRPTVLDTIIGPAKPAGSCSCGCARCGGPQGEAEVSDEFEAEANDEFFEADATNEFETDSELSSRFRRRGTFGRRARPGGRRAGVRRRIRPRTAARANSVFAKRLGWGRSFRSLANRMGLPALPPSSLPLVLAIARWQAARGLRPTGVLGPSTLAQAQDQGAPTGDATQTDDAAPSDDAEPTTDSSGVEGGGDAGTDTGGDAGTDAAPGGDTFI